MTYDGPDRRKRATPPVGRHPRRRRTDKKPGETLGEWMMRVEKEGHATALFWGFILLLGIIVGIGILAVTNFLFLHGFLGGA